MIFLNELLGRKRRGVIRKICDSYQASWLRTFLFSGYFKTGSWKCLYLLSVQQFMLWHHFLSVLVLPVEKIITFMCIWAIIFHSMTCCKVVLWIFSWHSSNFHIPLKMVFVYSTFFSLSTYVIYNNSSISTHLWQKLTYC